LDAWLVTILIFLPVAGGLLCFLFPIGGRAVASFGALVALVEVGFWIDAVARFDFAQGLQFEQEAPWFSDLNVSYHVGMYGFSLWLVGLTVVVMAAAIAYAFLAGRDRPRAYYGLMLMLTAT
jgi:NADH-quinone oxidoreductase subunit M